MPSPRTAFAVSRPETLLEIGNNRSSRVEKLDKDNLVHLYSGAQYKYSRDVPTSNLFLPVNV